MANDGDSGGMTEDELVSFFRSLGSARRKEYETLADLDRRHGEDVASGDDGGREKKSSESLS